MQRFIPAFPGKSADLVCKVENGKEYPINWIKISGDKKEDYEYFPLSTGKTLAIRDQRFNLRYAYPSLNSRGGLKGLIYRADIKFKVKFHTPEYVSFSKTLF